MHLIHDHQSKKILGENMKKTTRIVIVLLGLILIIFYLINITSDVAEAAGLIDDTIRPSNLYSKYPLNNYQLDFYVNSSWDWLPWNWGDGLGKSVMFGLYAITNFIWTVSLYLSNATGYVVQEAYRLDFISDTAESIGENIQTLAGITENGLTTDGFYFGFLLLIILIVGVYVTYTGILKRETTKAIRAVINFVVIFLLSGSFIAYAPTYIAKINEFSSDVSKTALNLGAKIVVPNSESKGKDSVELIRDSLFSIQVQQPWLLLQFDDSNSEEIGEERVNKILSVSPDENKGKDREEAVKIEIEENDNTNLSITKTMNRLGTVVFLVLFNIGISFFVFLLTGIMLFSQILFIIFAMFLPISFLLSMLPTYESLGKKAIVRLFNTIMMRAGVTLVVTIAFSISTMFFNISATYPFFMVAFLQIVTFAGIYFKLGDIMSMFKLQSSDSQTVGRRVIRRPQMMMNRKLRQLNRSIGKTVSFSSGAAVGAKATKVNGNTKTNNNTQVRQLRKNNQSTNKPKSSVDRSKQAIPPASKKHSRINQAGRKLGRVLDTKSLIGDKAKQAKQQAIDMPTNLKYQLHKGIEKTKKVPSDFKRGLVQEKKERVVQREKNRQQRQKRMGVKRQELANQKLYSFKKRGNVSLNRLAEAQGSLSKIKRQAVSSTPISPINRNVIRKQLLNNQTNLVKRGNHGYSKRKIKRALPRTGEAT